MKNYSSRISIQCRIITILRQKPLSFNKDYTITGMTLIFSVFIYLNILERRIQHGVWKGSLWGGKKVKEMKNTLDFFPQVVLWQRSKAHVTSLQALLQQCHYMSWHSTSDIYWSCLPGNRARRLQQLIRNCNPLMEKKLTLFLLLKLGKVAFQIN